MTKSIQKSIIKRQHKQMDYDRFRFSHQKLSNMADKSPSEEKNVFKLEGQLDTATKDYFYINDLLKAELDRFLVLTSELIPPLFDSFYNTQCQVYGGIYARIYEIVTSHSGLAFKTMDQSIEQGYLALVAQRDVAEELDHLDMFKKGKKGMVVLVGVRV
jgi:amphiphysin